MAMSQRSATMLQNRATNFSSRPVEALDAAHGLSLRTEQLRYQFLNAELDLSMTFAGFAFRLVSDNVLHRRQRCHQFARTGYATAVEVFSRAPLPDEYAATVEWKLARLRSALDSLDVQPVPRPQSTPQPQPEAKPQPELVKAGALAP